MPAHPIDPDDANPRQPRNGELTEATIFSIRKELAAARDKHPAGATLAALLKHAGKLAGVLIDEGKGTDGCRSCASAKARFEAVQCAVVVIRLIEGA